MLRSALRHRKISRLAELLGVPRYSAVGLVECLWHLTAVQAPRGDIGKLTDQEIAEGVFWPKRNSKRLIECLSSPHVLLIDTCRCHRLRVHDWNQHADQSVKKTVAKNLNGFIHCYLDKTHSGTIPDSNRNDSVLPVPEPAPVPEPEPVNGTRAETVAEAAMRLAAQNGYKPEPVVLVDGKPIDEIPCPGCGRKGFLRQSQARGNNPPGFWCHRVGGCGANWPLNTEAILSQMSSMGREAIERMAQDAPKKRKGPAPAWDRAADDQADIDGRAVAWVDARPVRMETRSDVQALADEAPADIRAAVAAILIARNPGLRETA